MHKNDHSQFPLNCIKESSKGRPKTRQLIIRPKEYDAIGLNKSELKHMHAIRPYCSKQRRSSREQRKISQSPYQPSRSKSKRFENSTKKIQECSLSMGGIQFNQILSDLKSQYKVLKNNYNILVAEKTEYLRIQQEKCNQLAFKLEQSNKETESYAKKSSLLEQEIDRIKKQCYKILEMEKFKVRKLQETLQQKDLMIAFLRNQTENLKKGGLENNQPLFFLQNNHTGFNFQYFSKQNSNLSAQSGIRLSEEVIKQKNDTHMEQDSLSLSRDKSKQMDSIFHSFLSNHQQSSYHFTKKQNIINNSLEQSPIENQIDIIEENSQKSEKSLLHCKRPGKESRDTVDKIKDTIIIKNKLKTNQKKLEIIITNENTDLNNTNEDTSLDTKRKLINSSINMCKQKKKMTAKKGKIISNL